MSRRSRGDAAIRQRKSDGRWYWRYTIGRDPATGKAIVKTLYGSTKTEVEIKKRKFLVELETTGKVAGTSRMTVEEWISEWLETYCVNIAPSTRKKYESDSRNRIVPYIGAARLSELKQADIQKYINTISQELKPRSVRNIYGTLHESLDKAKELDLIKTNPARNIELPRVIKEPITPLPESAVKSLVSALDGDFYRDPILFALYTGAREMEILGLTWACVNFSTATITVKQQLKREHGEVSLVPAKGGKTRTVPLVPQAVELLREQKAKQNQWKADSYGVFHNPLDLVFTNEIGGALVALSVRKHFKQAAAEIGCPDLRFHDLRHSYAVYQIRAGVDFKTISENMGHYSTAFTMDTYAFVTREMEKESARKLGGFFDNLTS